MRVDRDGKYASGVAVRVVVQFIEYDCNNCNYWYNDNSMRRKCCILILTVMYSETRRFVDEMAILMCSRPESFLAS